MCVIFFLSFRVASDILPERLEQKMHAYIKTRTTCITEESLVTQAVKMYAKRDIYDDNSNNDGGKIIDLSKLTSAMSKYQTIHCKSTKKNLKVDFLSKDPYGVNVVAFLIYRYQPLH